MSSSNFFSIAGESKVACLGWQPIAKWTFLSPGTFLQNWSKSHQSRGWCRLVTTPPTASFSMLCPSLRNRKWISKSSFLKIKTDLSMLSSRVASDPLGSPSASSSLLNHDHNVWSNQLPESFSYLWTKLRWQWESKSDPGQRLPMMGVEGRALSHPSEVFLVAIIFFFAIISSLPITFLSFLTLLVLLLLQHESFWYWSWIWYD